MECLWRRWFHNPGIRGKYCPQLFLWRFRPGDICRIIINKDLFAGAYQVLLSGDVGRDINVSAAAVEINGSVGGDATVSVAEPGGQTYYGPLPPGVSQMVNPGLRISDQAQIGGELVYTARLIRRKPYRRPPAAGLFIRPLPRRRSVKNPLAGTRTRPYPLGGSLPGHTEVGL